MRARECIYSILMCWLIVSVWIGYPIFLHIDLCLKSHLVDLSVKTTWLTCSYQHIWSPSQQVWHPTLL
jgi:hypothetical protein